jgi:hypothetical protein
MSYSPTPAVKAFGSILYYAPIVSGAPGTWVEIAYTEDLKTPDIEVGDIKITNNQSPNNTHEYMPGLIEGGTVEYDIVYTSSVAGTLYGLLDAATTYAWQEVYPDGAAMVWFGYVKGFGIEGKTEDGDLKNKMKVKVCSKPTFTSGS